MFQQKNNQKVVCNMYNLAPILVSNFPLLLLPTGSPLMKLWQFWPFQSPPDHPKCYLTAKSSPQPSIHIFRKSQKKLATFPIDFFRGIAKVWEGGHFTPPPASDRVKDWPSLMESLEMRKARFSKLIYCRKEKFENKGPFPIPSGCQSAPNSRGCFQWLGTLSHPKGRPWTQRRWRTKS